MVKLSLEEDKKKENPIDKKTVEEAEQIVNYFKGELKTIEEELFDDEDIPMSEWNRNWDKDAQLYVILKLYLNYGVLRTSELIGLKITDTDEGCDKINYYNIWTK